MLYENYSTGAAGQMTAIAEEFLKKQIQDRYDRGNHKRDGAEWDRHFLLKLAQETTNTATEIPEMFKQVLSVADQPAGSPAGDKGKPFRRQKVPEGGFSPADAPDLPVHPARSASSLFLRPVTKNKTVLAGTQPSARLRSDATSPAGGC